MMAREGLMDDCGYHGFDDAEIMAEMSREEAINQIGEWYGGFAEKPSEDAIHKAISDMQKMKKIEKFINNYDGAIIISENMGIVSGQTLIDELKQIVKE